MCKIVPLNNPHSLNDLSNTICGVIYWCQSSDMYKIVPLNNPHSLNEQSNTILWSDLLVSG